MFQVSRRRRAISVLLTLGLLMGVLALPGPAAAGQQVLTTFDFTLFNSCTDGVGPADTELTIELRNSTGDYQGHQIVMTDGNGAWSACFWSDISGGDRLSATDGSTTRTFIVQPIQFRINRVTDVVSGTTVPSSQVVIAIYDCHTDWQSCSLEDEVTRNTGGNGNFSYDSSNLHDIKGQDFVRVIWDSPQGDQERRALDAPRMSVQVNDNWSGGDARPGSDVTMWLFDSRGNQRARFTDRASQSGSFSGEWNRNGNAVNVAVGNFVGSNIATDATMRVLNMNPQMNTSDNTIEARCWKNKPFYLYVEESQSPWDWADTYGTVNGQGRFTVDTDDLGYDLESGDKVFLECLNPQGDSLEALFRVP